MFQLNLITLNSYTFIIFFFKVKGQTYEFGKLPTDEPEVINTTFFESENEGVISLKFLPYYIYTILIPQVLSINTSSYMLQNVLTLILFLGNCKYLK